MAQTNQRDFFKKTSRSFGGDLLKKGKNRHARPISTLYSMHFVLRSTQAHGEWSFWRHKRAIGEILEKFARRNGVKLLAIANVGNHLHLHMQLSNRHTYRAFIRAITSAIMMRVTGVSRWKKVQFRRKFWDLRPFSRIIVGFKAILTMRDYIQINILQGDGYSSDESRFMIKWSWDKGKFR